jgi:hypothetical protein
MNSFEFETQLMIHIAQWHAGMFDIDEMTRRIESDLLKFNDAVFMSGQIQEREACALIADDQSVINPNHPLRGSERAEGYQEAAQVVARKIRERGA